MQYFFLNIFKISLIYQNWCTLKTEHTNILKNPTENLNQKPTNINALLSTRATILNPKPNIVFG